MKHAKPRTDGVASFQLCGVSDHYRSSLPKYRPFFPVQYVQASISAHIITYTFIIISLSAQNKKS
jgi:hypothetical protein